MRPFHRTYCIAALLGVAPLFMSDTARGQTPMPGMGPVAAQETTSWDNVKAGRYDAVYAMWAPDFVYSGPEGLGGREPSIAGLKGCTIHSYTFGPAMYRMIGKDGVLVSYTISMDANCGPAPNSSHYTGDLNCTSTWVKRDGKWLELAHTAAIPMKMPEPPPSPPAQ